MGRRAKADWAQAQGDRDRGASVAAIAKKYGVSSVTVYKRTRGNGRRGGGPAPQSAGAGHFKIDYIPRAEAPVGRCKLMPAEYLELFDALKRCPADRAIRAPLTARMRKVKKPAGSVRDFLRRMLRIEKIEKRFTVVVEGDYVYVTPR